MTSALREFSGEIRADILSGKVTPALSAGFTSGLGLLAAQVAFGTFIFSGPLAPYTSQGVGLVLFGNFAACLLIALASGYRGAISGLSPALVIGMAVIGSTMAAEGDALFVTTAAALIIAAVATGAFCLVIGRFHLANVVRFIPYPVAGGFVAGIGGAVCIAALSMMGVDPHWAAVPGFFDPAELWKWAPGAVLRARPLPVDAALASSADPAGERRALRRRKPSRSLRPRHKRRGGESRGPAVHEHGGGEPVACPVTRRLRARGLVGDGRADPRHADADPGRPHLRRHEHRGPGACGEQRARLGPGVQGQGLRDRDLRPGRRHGVDPGRSRLAPQQAVRRDDAAHRRDRSPCHRGRAAVRRRDAGGWFRRRSSAACWSLREPACWTRGW